MIISVKNGIITVGGNGNIQEIFDYFKPDFPGIRIKGTSIVGVFSIPLMDALVESPFYDEEDEIERQFCV